MGIDFFLVFSVQSTRRLWYGRTKRKSSNYIKKDLDEAIHKIISKTSNLLFMSHVTLGLKMTEEKKLNEPGRQKLERRYSSL